MAGGKKQVTGYKYYTTLVSFIGNYIEGLVGINFDKRGWIQSEEVKDGLMKTGIHTFNAPDIFGENEGGIGGKIAIYGGSQVNADEHYQQHYALVPAYKERSYLVFRDFYVGNNPFLKEMMLCPQRIHVKNDGSAQWYDEKAEIADYSDYVEPKTEFLTITNSTSTNTDTGGVESFARTAILTTTNGEVSWLAFDGLPRGNSVSLIAGLDYFADIEIILKTGGVAVFDVSFGAGGKDGAFELQTNAKILGYTQKSESTYIVHQYKLEMRDIEEIKLNLRITKETPDGKILSIFPYRATVNLSPFSTKNIGKDINPIHKIRELLTDKSAMNKPESDINEANFIACADRIFDEGLGISWAIQEKSCVDALNELCTHIEAGVRVNRQTGLYEVVLFRDDLNSTESALLFDESNIKSLQLDIQNSDEMINTLNVSYYDRENIKKSTFNVYENGLIRTVGYEQSENIDFPYFMNRRNAEIVANWKLKQFSTQAFKGSFTTGLYDARKINRFDIILLSWSNRRINNMPVRVTGINLGDGVNNTVTIEFTEIVAYSNMMQANINTDASNNVILPPQENESIVLEVPYYEAVQVYGEVDVNAQLDNTPEMGYLMVATKRPQNNSLSAQLHTTAGAGWERVGTVHYAPSCNISNELGYLDTTILVNGVSGFSELQEDIIGQINNELIAFASFDSYSNILTIKRGILDTIPQKHNVGDSIYFWDNSNGVDSTPYLMGEAVNAKILTTTPSGIQNFDTAPLLALNMNARAIRPYPPANVKINDEYYPSEFSGNLKLTWADRNRKQQTGGSIIAWTDSSVTLETGVNYQLILTEFDENNTELRTQSISVGSLTEYTMNVDVMQANTRSIEIQLKSMRDNFENYQTFTHSVELSTFFTAPYDIEYTVSE